MPAIKIVSFNGAYRHYDSYAGRWTNRDPILFNGGDTNLYGYAMMDPVNFADPSGLWTVQIGGTASISIGGFSVNFGGGLAIDGQGNVATYSSFGGGASTGAGISAGATAQGSNAMCVQDLAGPFTTSSVGGGEGLNASVDTFGGLGSHNQPVIGGGFTIGGGFGGASSVTHGPTSISNITNPFH